MGVELAEGDAEGPAVADDVVGDHGDHVMVGELHEQPARQGTFGQVEGLGDDAVDGGQGGVEVGGAGDLQPGRGVIGDDLVGLAPVGADDGAQAVVAGGELVDGPAQAVGVEVTVGLGAEHEVRHDGAGVELVDEPQAGLAEGGGHGALVVAGRDARRGRGRGAVVGQVELPVAPAVHEQAAGRAGIGGRGSRHVGLRHGRPRWRSPARRPGARTT